MDRTLDDFPRDTPLRLEAALRVAFPAGGITIRGLRSEVAKGRLEVELIAGKIFTTLAAIDRMRERCRVTRKGHSLSKLIEERDRFGARGDGLHDLTKLVSVHLERASRRGKSKNAKR